MDSGTAGADGGVGRENTALSSEQCHQLVKRARVFLMGCPAQQTPSAQELSGD